MFDKILIANRGEIACRVMETAQRMGVACVAVYSDADAGAKHVAMADEAVHIGGPAPADSYLKGDVIIAAALETGAQAIHPGYGFLSENPGFVDAVEAAGLTFIGPSASAIRAMGLKDAAKALMHEAGVPVVPGYHGDNQDPEHLAGAADTIGYPVLIKAVAGGGGKGMRLVERPQDFAAALDSARGEASTAFGNDAVLVEKFVSKPRHIEVQVFGDGTHAVHLFERDCSLQRRHQKVIEEAPAPGMTEEMRAAMGQAGVRAAEAIGYKGAGTVEFIVDASDGLRADRFWFMEMNTRLQVEHPVTEAITGVDLVEWQLRVAAGESLPARQEELSITGHAFEARLYAEDVPKGFLPATGTLSHLAFPEGCRADSGVRAGDTISPWYDPMISKVIVHGPTRAVALSRLDRALAGTQVGGTVTNLAFLGALTRHAGFAAGDVDTGLIGRDIDALVAAPAPEPRHVAAAAMAVLGLAGDQAEQGFTLWAPLHRAITLGWQGEELAVDVQVEGRNRQLWQVGADQVVAERHDGRWRIGGRAMPDVSVAGGVATVFDGYGLPFDIIDPLERDSSAGGDTNVVLAPMPGLVKAVFAAAGQAVQEGDRLAILEAMKMEHSLLAARDGVVAEVLAEAGAQVEAGAALVRLVEEEA
ncbi:acetyl/propionyl/methylcrotonyl-CoA carboxylase subunit alpha [Ruegeria pomeroyi]|uniref:Methylcrotonyl-CoA carboxylase, alpha subunit n=2 Tax=Ruegeria pomeroyi TaxID=89184 RepID=Q5LPR0_RUEPO|nr:acetyl/propionyl/methylcrotonyl-CoA carboxylase subunit alpha [Ruegeria pomeroyi]AAV96030.1 methylcrotonyl-CoA carboxylase, alpha subunit [Ruegeria pomeroyi DSS-3]NVK97946.1 acetyl/propionyl/methylcrotonyl-CoA carboxylase subunit alpha [Ruegeria pomeroyi]NVL01854.1 acetyl/propionyl/methylcrotonyl-CoA carboxylase subunit alpha [Ruegeria pomeroyi]QWV09589.1 acetyl/propionyl/methylcrotonyl-CoA carboxylase subunit alpha [Ruegeria pomeroyi]